MWSIPYFICVVCLLLKISAETDSITASQSLRDGDTLVSSGGSFELGFFSPGVSKGRYLGIWYKNIPVQTVVWVANREAPVSDMSGSLEINITGSLKLLNGTKSVVWSANPVRLSRDPVLQLLDSGNLVLRDKKDGSTDVYLWQSFDYPSDTLLPGMKLGWDLRTKLNRRLSSWKSPNDPSPGELSNFIELDTYPQVVMLKGTAKYFRGGPWNGLRFSGAPELKTNPMFSFKFVSNEDEVYYVYEMLDRSVITRLVLNDTTSSRLRYVWVEADRSWKVYASVPRDYCDTYGLCGAYGICVISDSPVCQCLEGFKPKQAQSWNAMDWSHGCEHDEPLDCVKGDDFVRFSGVKLPDTAYSWLDNNMNLRECREACSKNCSCMAYANSDISGQGKGCALWFSDLIDIRKFSDGGQDLYIRMPASNRGNNSLLIVAIIVAIIASICGVVLVIWSLFRRKMKAKGQNEEDSRNSAEDLDLPLLKLDAVANATDNFSMNKKLGEGGFGPVYKGLLVNGQNVAVKRLSKSSGQGVNEFLNEVKLIAELQHRNLVKLLSCCIDGGEKILVYEYMPNGSLDSLLFDQTRASALGWSKRFNIICGVARGLLYLHQDSRLRIIHRDLKASNILLDDELNPKISDFGMARTFRGDQTEENTRRIVGTYGYMAPEYAIYGLFSVKSDVFSFGILLLEIVSGKKHHHIIEYAWTLWTEGRPLDLIDPAAADEVLVRVEMVRCVHVGLLCIQQSPDDRPNMSTVVLMLNGESVLPEPKQPGFLIDLVTTKNESCSSSMRNESCSVNDFTITAMEAR
ncbi:S-locus lectin protein kinase family protein [Perilla frutescens var. hirtella]|nr:S-locus lectin protein kinase family protein [Perilla frutescens var. hirtella]